jgi:hypothetical protein
MALSNTIPIIGGPDKWTLISAFADRKVVEFKTPNNLIRLRGVISSIEHEDGSTNSFNVGLQLDHQTRLRVYYRTKSKRGYASNC